MQKITNIYQVNFSPTIKHLNEIEKWLIAESRKTGEGFYCNWTAIKMSFDDGNLVTISYNSETIGFVTLWFVTGKTAVIDIAEVKPAHRKNGVGKALTNEVLNFLRHKGICVAYLKCSPETSEPIWKKLGFIEFPDPADKYNFRVSDDKQLYKILTEHLQTSSSQLANETIELWNDEPYKTVPNAPPTYIWNLEFEQGSRKLVKSLIQPGSREWRIRWRNNGKTIIDDRVKYFGREIDFGTFIIIDEL